MEELVREGRQIVGVDGVAHRAVGPADIRIDKACCAEVVQSNEVRLAVEKRFKTKRTFYGEPGFGELVPWCLSTDSYKLCQRNLERVSDSDVDLVWQFIDTASVSSTRPCREIIGKYKGSRSAVGFRREHVRSAPSASSHLPPDGNTASPALVLHTRNDTEGYGTLNSLLTEDCMHWVTNSPDPTTSALRLRSRLLEGNKGSHDPWRHRR